MPRTSPVSLVAALAGALAACSANSNGRAPPLDAFHYPIAGAIAPTGDWLYVVNSDFNLRYNGGSVVAVDLAAVRDRIAAGLVPAPTDTEAPFITGNAPSVQINPFATAAALASDGSRLYVTVRGDGTLTWIDVAGGQLSCNTTDSAALCDATHRVGRDPATTGRGLILPPLPASIGIIERDDGVRRDRFIAVAHQESTESRMSLFRDDGVAAPTLEHWVAGLPSGLSVAFPVNVSAAGVLTDPGASPHWYAVSRDLPVLGHVRAVDGDGGGAYLYASKLQPIVGVAGDVGIRGLVRDPCDPRRAYATSRAGPGSGTQTTRSGDQLLRLDLSDPDDPVVDQVMAMPPGPSNLVAIAPRGVAQCGTTHSVLYTVSYDARKLYVIDVDDWREVDQIRTQAGPHVLLADPSLTRPLAADGAPVRGLLYLIDFVAMCVEVIDVDPDHPTYNRVVFTIGDVVPPQTNL